MSLSNLRLVSLDVTNTLIKVRGSPAYQYCKAARSFGIEVDQKLLSSAWLQKYKEFSDKYPNFGAENQMSAHTWWSELVKESFQSVDASLDQTALENTADFLYHHFHTCDAWEVLPGARAALKDLWQYPVKTAVISNFDDRLPRVLDALKLLDCFDFVLPSYTVGVQKPDPAIFHLALNKANCRPEEAIHIGDHIKKDYFGARSAGMESFLLSESGETTSQAALVDQNHVVPDLQTFVDTIRHRLGQPLDHE